MQSKTGIIILIILIIVVAIFAVVAAGGISLGGGKKVTIMGTVFYSMWPGPGWGVTYDDSVVTDDGFLATLWYFPWETKDINIVVEMSNGKEYKADVWTDKINLIAGSTTFSIDLRHVANGIYSGKIFVYEVEKGFLWGEKSRILQASTNFEVIV